MTARGSSGSVAPAGSRPPFRIVIAITLTGIGLAGGRGAIVASFVGVNRLGQTVGPVVAGAGLGTVGSHGVFLGGAVLAALMAAAFPFVRFRSTGTWR
ncbi:MAG TPA: hypothetical protein VM143_03675 [Acidimicrobiales bacterium]|nr:hypothetical protein [Acidimicrobiales bacterium]